MIVYNFISTVKKLKLLPVLGNIIFYPLCSQVILNSLFSLYGSPIIFCYYWINQIFSIQILKQFNPILLLIKHTNNRIFNAYNRFQFTIHFILNLPFIESSIFIEALYNIFSLERQKACNDWCHSQANWILLW